MKDLLGQEYYKRSGDDLQNQGLYLDLPAHGAQLFHFQPINSTDKELAFRGSCVVLSLRG